MTLARTDLTETEADLAASLRLIRDAFHPADGSAEDEALCGVETFCDIALRVMRKTNPSKVRSEARNVELKARLDGVPVLRGAA